MTRRTARSRFRRKPKPRKKSRAPRKSRAKPMDPRLADLLALNPSISSYAASFALGIPVGTATRWLNLTRKTQ